MGAGCVRVREQAMATQAKQTPRAEDLQGFEQLYAAFGPTSPNAQPWAGDTQTEKRVFNTIQNVLFFAGVNGLQADCAASWLTRALRANLPECFAAPDLLAALEALLGDVDTLLQHSTDHLDNECQGGCEYCKHRKQARAALAKAGE